MSEQDREAFEKTFPGHIWLDVGEDAKMDIAPGDTFHDLHEVTWSEDNATGYGVKYVRVDLVSAPDSAGEAGPWSEKTALEKAPSIIMQLEVAAERFTRYSHDTIDGLLQEAADVIRALAAPHPVGSALTEALALADSEGARAVKYLRVIRKVRAVVDEWPEVEMPDSPLSRIRTLVAFAGTGTPAVKGYHPGVSGEATAEDNAIYGAIAANYFAAPSHPPATADDALSEAAVKEGGWEQVARVQNAKLMAMTDSKAGFQKLCEVMDRYAARSGASAQPAGGAE